MKIKIVINYTSLCCRAFEDWNGLVIPEDEMQKILDFKLNDLQNQLERWGYTGEETGLDTCERETLFDSVAQYIGFTHWPMNMESDEHWAEDFHKALTERWTNEI